MKILIRSIALLLTWMVVTGAVLAGDNDKAGTTSAVFLKLGVGARAAALGNAVIGSATDASAVFWNPGALGAIRSSEVMLSYDRWFEQMQHGFIGITMPGVGGTTSLGLIYFNSGPMTRTEAAPGGGYVTKEDFSNMDGAVLLGYGFRIAGETHFGITGKAIYENLAGESAFAFAGDAGIYSRIEMVDFGIVGSNIGSKLKFKDEGYDLPMKILGGIAVHFAEYGVTVSAAGGSVSEGRTQFSFGAEYKPLEFLAIRAGYRTGMQEITGGMKGLAGGIGVGTGDIRLDYAYNPYGDLGPTHHVSLGFRLSGGGAAQETPVPAK
jgi:hypothetical protein